MQKFINLWLHRFRKYTHVFKVYFHFYQAYLKFYFLKKHTKKSITVIVLTQQFGDIVAGEPLSRQVRSAHPNDYIFWIVKPIFRELLENNPNLDGIHEEFCPHQRKLLIESGIFDKIYNLQFRNNSHCPTCNIYVENPEADIKNITIHNYYFQGNLLTVQQKIAGLPTEDLPPKLYISDQNVATIDALKIPKNFVVIHCQSAQNSRNWDSTKWLALVSFITQNTDYQVVEVGLVSSLNSDLSKYINLCGKLSILETAELIKRAKLFVGVDSGPAHLANAVGTYGVIMIGKLENFTQHIPYSGDYKSGVNATIVRNLDGASADIDVQTVIDAINQTKLLVD